ncbi:PCRF domain-containing protein, partial [Patescibacteria group bacterium]|nr:PCRF domain-containing protein [Patescibacteria group bacterium]
MKDIKQRVKRVSEEYSRLTKSVDLKKEKTRLLELEAKTTDPNFWDDREAAKKIMQDFGDLKDEIEEIEKLELDIKALADLVRGDKGSSELESEISSIEKRIEKLKLTSYLSGPYDKKVAIVSIHAGQGGTEAMDWVSMLYRMYLKFCEGRGWKTRELDSSPGEEAGLKSVTFTVSGAYSYVYLKGEAGTHRLVRQS